MHKKVEITKDPLKTLEKQTEFLDGPANLKEDFFGSSKNPFLGRIYFLKKCKKLDLFDHSLGNVAIFL